MFLIGVSMRPGVVYLSSGLIALGALMGFRASTQKVVEAEKFVLRSPKGKTLLEMRVEDERAVIAFCDESGKERVQIEGGVKPGIVVRNSKGKAVLEMRDFAQDGSGFILCDKEGRKRFQVQGGDSPGLFVLNDQKQVIANFGASSGGHSNLTLRGPEGEPLVALSGSKVPGLVVRHGLQTQVEMVATQNGAMMKFNDSQGNPRVQLQGGGSPGVFLRQDKGDVIGSFVTLKSGGSAIGLGNEQGEIASFLRGGQSPSLSFFQNEKQPDVILGITEKAPHLIMSRTKEQEGVLLYGGSPSSMLFINEKGQIPVIISKHGILQERTSAKPQEKKQEKFYSWEEFENPLKELDTLRKR